MKTLCKKITACLVSAAMLIAAPYDFHVFAKTKNVAVDENESKASVRVLVKAEDYTAVASKIDGASETGFIAENEVEAESAADAVEKALKAAGVEYDMSKGYVSEVNGLSSAEGYGMSGWMLAYNDDDCDNWGLDYINIKDGETKKQIYTLDGGADIASASSGLPTLKKLEIAGMKYEFQTITEYDDDWNPSYTYKVNGEQIEGLGTKEKPFTVSCSVAADYSESKITYSYSTYANENYVSVDAGDYIYQGVDNEIIVTSRGGRKAYYKITVLTGGQPESTPKPTETPKPTGTPEPTETPEPTATPEHTDSPETTENPGSASTPLPASTEPANTQSPVQTAQPLPVQTAVPSKTPDIQPKTPGKVKVKSIKLSGNKLKAAVKKVKGAKGYKFTAAADKALKKNAKVKYTSKTNVTFTKCNKKSYYLKVQAYVIGTDGKKIFGRASGAVRIKRSSTAPI